MWSSSERDGRKHPDRQEILPDRGQTRDRRREDKKEENEYDYMKNTSL